ncbi:uncharacterized protein HD556DRAFT_1305980 [Suillus plorans]|uniref:Uncharacterized protein n=1 Tax=Suillus plorans TaxID=116603 RepID=A0A9P7J0U9_9AGAM|nr:uncharacterized protein HD556DRAFT_1305980 [Suillus plorans]KAG1798517.1 hypothetical protein HD556DRAFT_1305980 [Suillus plorans]
MLHCWDGATWCLTSSTRWTLKLCSISDSAPMPMDKDEQPQGAELGVLLVANSPIQFSSDLIQVLIIKFQNHPSIVFALASITLRIPINAHYMWIFAHRRCYLRKRADQTDFTFLRASERCDALPGTKDQLHTFACKGDDSMKFNDKDAVDLMILIIQGLEDPNTIELKILLAMDLPMEQWQARLLPVHSQVQTWKTLFPLGGGCQQLQECLKAYFNKYFTTVAPAQFAQYNITADSASQAKKRARINGPTHTNGNDLEAEELITVETTMQICPLSL